MDAEQARTFISVMETRNFVRAAELLNVTQSTVSARIKALENRLGCRLFNRSKAGVFLTAEGARFARHAANFVRLWGQARQEVGLPEHFTARINIGAQISHWDNVVVNWVAWLRRSRPELAIRVEVGSNDSLMRQVLDGMLDVAIVYTPQSGPGLSVEPLFEERIILVCSEPAVSRGNGENNHWRNRYVYVDWGSAYRTEHALAWPDLETPPLYFGVGTVALDFILRYGGAGYFPTRQVRQHLAERKLFRVSGTPTFTRPVYMVTTDIFAEPPFDDLLTELQRIAIYSQSEDRAQLTTDRTAVETDI